MVDRKYGDWIKRLHRDGTPDDSNYKVGPWECPYHHSRACFEMLDRLERPIILSAKLRKSLQNQCGRTAFAPTGQIRSMAPTSAQPTIDQVIIQPLPAAHLHRWRAAGMQGMFLGLLVALRAVVDGLDGRAEERVKQRTEQTAQDGNAGYQPEIPGGTHQPGQDGDQGRTAAGPPGCRRPRCRRRCRVRPVSSW